MELERVLVYNEGLSNSPVNAAAISYLVTGETAKMSFVTDSVLMNYLQS